MQVALFIIGVILGVTAAETQNSDVLKRLDTTEALLRTLFNEVELLKSQNKLQKAHIAELEAKGRYQLQRSSNLEGLVRRLMTNIRQKKTSVPKPEPHFDKGFFGKPTSRIRRAVNESRVAFFAKMGKHIEHAGQHQIMVFESVATNVGNAYNNHVGTFTAPVSGIYVFSATLVSFYHVNAHAYFMKNGRALSTFYVSGGEAGRDTSSQTIVLQLQKGDDVCIQNLESDTSYYGYNYSIFSGFLLQEDLTSTAVVGR